MILCLASIPLFSPELAKHSWRCCGSIRAPTPKPSALQSYLVRISGERLCFGIERCGHSGGYWFCPTVTETDGRLLLRGKLTSGCTPSPNKWYIQMFEALDTVCMALLLAPFFLPVKLCRAIGNGIRRLRGLPPKREETTEDRLCALMETLLGCTPA